MQRDKIQEDAAKYVAILRNTNQKKVNENDLNPLQIRDSTRLDSSFYSQFYIDSISFSPQKIMSEHKQIRLKIINLIKKRFKNPNNQMDYNGKGKVTKQNFFASMVDIKNKISCNQIESFFKSEKIFQENTPFQSVDFTKFMSVFFPVIRAEEDKEEEQHLNAENERSPIPTHLRNSSQSLMGVQASQPSFGSKTTSQSIKNIPLDERLKKAEELIKEKLQVNYSSARRAFLELDSDYDGYISAQDLIIRLMNAASLAQGDLKMLFKLKSAQKDGRLNFSSFVKWFGPVIEPESDFYFRHDESGLRKQQLDRIYTRQSQIKQQNLQEMIKKMSSDNIEQKLKNIIQTQWKSVNKAFMDLNKDHTHYISQEQFKSFLSQRCGFKITEKEFMSFFNRIDKDGDGKLSYPDFNTYFGFEINPGQDLFFRQQAPLPKKQTSQIIKKWVGQVKLTQKINRGHIILQQLAMKLGDDKWNDLIKKLLQHDKLGDYTIEADVFFENLQKFSPYQINQWDRQCILSALMTANDDGKVNIHHLFNAKYKVQLTNRAKNLLSKRSSSQSPRVVANLPKPKTNEECYRQFSDLLYKQGKTQEDILKEIYHILESKSTEEEVLSSLYNRIGLIIPELRSEKFKSVLSSLILKCQLTRSQKAQLNIKREILASSGISQNRQRFNSTRSSRNSVRVHKRSQSQLRNIPSMPPISRNKNILNNYTTIDVPNPRNQIPNDDNQDSGFVDKFIKENQPVNRNSISPLKMAVSNSMGNLAKRRLKMLKTKLQYEWTNIYRTLISKDLDQCQFVSATDFKAAVIRSGIYLDKDNWRTISTNFVQGDNVFYRDMSIRLGLHRAGLQSMSSANLHNYLTKIQKMKRQIVSQFCLFIVNQSPEDLRIQMRRSISQKNLQKSLQLNGDRDSILKKNKGVLKRLFRNFDNNNNSSVTKYDFLNITKKCGLRLSQNEIQPFEIKEKKGGLTDRGQRHQLKPTLKQLQLTNSTKKIDYKKFLDRLEAKKQ